MVTTPKNIFNKGLKYFVSMVALWPAEHFLKNFTDAGVQDTLIYVLAQCHSVIRRKDRLFGGRFTVPGHNLYIGSIQFQFPVVLMCKDC